jgi:hypothetical protein
MNILLFRVPRLTSSDARFSHSQLGHHIKHKQRGWKWAKHALPRGVVWRQNRSHNCHFSLERRIYGIYSKTSTQWGDWRRLPTGSPQTAEVWLFRCLQYMAFKKMAALYIHGLCSSIHTLMTSLLAHTTPQLHTNSTIVVGLHSKVTTSKILSRWLLQIYLICSYKHLHQFSQRKKK